MEKLVVVNERDEEIGLENKLEAHLGKGILHRAFTILLFNSQDQLLIQKRSKNKFLWPLVWETSCSGHPFPKESYIKAGERRLREELGITCKLKFLTKFQYWARYKNIGSECEVCALLVGIYEGEVKPNPKEIAVWQWVDLKILKEELKKNPEEYVLWLKLALKYYENCK